MRADLDAKLVREHPILFGDRHGDMRRTAMCWGFECGDGWYSLLKEAADKLEPLCRAVYEKEAVKEKKWYKYARLPAVWAARFPWRWLSHYLFVAVRKITKIIAPGIDNGIEFYGGSPCRASQVKEKFGTLRFYMTAETKEMRPIIEEAERKSAVTCEQCGKKGKLRGNGWLYTACAACHKKRENR